MQRLESDNQLPPVPRGHLMNTQDKIMTVLLCGFKRSMQHLTSEKRKKDVADEEVSTQDLLHRSR